jgi:long-chain fatty acid transport protein
MKKTHIAAAVLVAFGCLLKTQTVRAAGYEFEGVGARRVGAGGAAIADSDDWTAIYWNPANIVRAAQGGHKDIGVELFAGEVYGHDSNSLSGLPGQTFRFEKDDLHSNFILGAIGAAIPIGQKAAVGFGFYTPLLQGAKFQAVQDASPRTDLDFDGSATILTWNVSGSYQFTPRFSAGAGLNLLYGRFSSNINIKNYAMAGDNLNSTLNGNGLGLEGTFGLRYDVCDKFSVGGVFRSGNDVKIKGGASADYTSAFPVPGVTSNSHSDFTYPLRHPAT